MSRKLKIMIGKRKGRGFGGKISVRARGGGSKRYLRKIDFSRSKKGIVGVIERIEYDPGRNVDIALVVYKDGERGYILAPYRVNVGDEIIADANAEVKPGNALPLASIPVGTPIHNLELFPGKGGQIVRGAGTMAIILAKEIALAQVKLPSGEIRNFSPSCWATVGQLANPEEKLNKLAKAGDSRHRGIRPTVRGVAQDPHSHPHGGGEGRSGIGMSSPKSPWGKKTLGKKTRKKRKYSDKFIVKRRK